MKPIRQATPSDAEAISQLLDQLQHPSTPHYLSQRIAKAQPSELEHIQVAVDQGRVVGVMALQITEPFHQEPPTARILDLCIMDTHRRMQYGRLLLDHAESIARDAGCIRVEVTSNNFRQDAHQFYARTGYDQTHRYFCKSLDSAT